MNIYLIRHGETDWNLIGKVQGREDIPLNDTGRMQAKKCAIALQDAGIKTIITSPLMRATQTANIISNSIDSTASIELIIDDGLIERDFGDMSGMTYDRRKYFDTFGLEETMEPLDILSKRLLDCIYKYAEKYRNQDIVMVSHGAAINSVIMALTEGEKGSGKTRLKNACISILTYVDNELQLGSYNMTADEFMDLKQP